MGSDSEISDELNGSSTACDNFNTAMITESINDSNNPEEMSTDLRLNSSGFSLENSNAEEYQRIKESLRGKFVNKSIIQNGSQRLHHISFI